MYNANKEEQNILKFWKEDNTFEKSVNERPADKPFVFYDGPPFATGLPHYGHIVASCMKDVVPRYQTMCGNRVERIWGWDCHGLPIENIVEKELGTKSKQEVEELGVDVFNEKCRSKVLSYTEEWEKTITRLGRWVDMDRAYKTMDKDYMESIWWVFKQLWEKGLIYKGYKPMHICPRCETTLSQQEVSEGYKDVKDLSVTAQFRLKTKNEKLKDVEGDVYILAWTTTPWTLPGNVLLAVGAEVEYAMVKCEDAHFVVAKELLLKNFEGKEFEVVGHVFGKDLVGLSYEPLFPYFADSENAFRVVTADFVTVEDGTGIVHLAPAFGTDDYEVFKEENVPFIQHVKMNGRFIDAVTDFAGMHVKPADDHMKTDVEIIKWLAHNGKLFSKKKYEHSYPHCWRCDTPLINYATDSWFVAVTKVKEDALKQAKNINWSPAHIKEGRFGKWLEGARDWSISRQRFWATPLPLWIAEDGDTICVGSAKELEELSGETVEDLHKHKIDHITIEKDGKVYRRSPDVLDTWFDSGSMPYAQVHYPFENKEKFDASFPAEFIAEGQDQTRAWFYYLHVLSTALKGTHAFNNVIVNGIVLAEDGKKMSKKLKNYPDPNVVLEKYGADALRYYLLSSPVVAAENLAFTEEGVREVFNKVCNTLSNVVAFYELFQDQDSGKSEPQASQHVLDIWIMALLNQLVETVTAEMDAYRLNDAARPIMDFILDLSQWYVRRSRDRFKAGDAAGVATLRQVLETLSKVMAPFTPFIAEQVFQKTRNQEQGTTENSSVHLELWPEAGSYDEVVLTHMTQLRKLVELGLSARSSAGQRVRQPLAKAVYSGAELSVSLEEILKAELNVKEVERVDTVSFEAQKTDANMTVGLDTELTEELRAEGLAREMVRTINGMRKQAGLTREDRITVAYASEDAPVLAALSAHAEDVARQVLADSFAEGEAAGDAQKLGAYHVHVSIKKV